MCVCVCACAFLCTHVAAEQLRNCVAACARAQACKRLLPLPMSSSQIKLLLL